MAFGDFSLEKSYDRQHVHCRGDDVDQDPYIIRTKLQMSDRAYDAFGGSRLALLQKTLT
jgi:hypothetical protein